MARMPIDKLALQIIKEEFTDLLILDLEGKTREEVLLNITKFAKKKGLIKDEQFVYQKFLDREKFGTTAIGQGIALPEACWIDMARPYAFIICRTKEEIDFNSLDNKDARIILASLGRDKEDASRMKPMAHLVRALKSMRFRTGFLKAKTEEDVYSILCAEGMGFSELRKKYISRQKN